MQYNPFKDPKFLTALVDVLISTALFFVGKYGAPALFDDLKFLIGAYQSIVILLIAGYFQADAASINKGILPPHISK